MKELTCDMIRDLMPLCAEGLCSEESRNAVEAHIATCDACRRLYEQPPAEEAVAVETAPNAAGPELPKFDISWDSPIASGGEMPVASAATETAGAPGGFDLPSFPDFSLPSIDSMDSSAAAGENSEEQPISQEAMADDGAIQDVDIASGEQPDMPVAEEAAPVAPAAPVPPPMPVPPPRPMEKENSSSVANQLGLPDLGIAVEKPKKPQIELVSAEEAKEVAEAKEAVEKQGGSKVPLIILIALIIAGGLACPCIDPDLGFFGYKKIGLAVGLIEPPPPPNPLSPPRAKKRY